MNDEEEELIKTEGKSPKEVMISLWWVWILVIFVFVFHGRLGMFIMDKALAYFSFVFLFVLLAHTGIITWKNATAKIIFNPRWSTTDGVAERVGNYAVYRLGVIDAYEIHTKGGSEGTLIVPISSINKVGRSVAVTCRVEKVKFDELPTEIQVKTAQDQMREPFYLGFADEEQELSKPEIVQLELELKERNKQITMLRDVISGKYGDIEKVVGHASRIGEMAKGSLLEKLKSALKEKEE